MLKNYIVQALQIVKYNFSVTEWLPVRKLRLFSKSSKDSDSPTSVATQLDLESPDPFIATTTLNPFSEGYVQF